VTFEGNNGELLAVVTLYVQLTRDLLAIAKFLVSKYSSTLSPLLRPVPYPAIGSHGYVFDLGIFADISPTDSPPDLYPLPGIPT